ncbi:MAG: transposase [Candidatus Entotheonellia bacterium]
MRLDAEVHPVAELAELYRRRWQVETSLAHLKATMQMDVLHCKTVPGVLKELTVFAIVYNLVCMVMWQSATLQAIGVERISFLDALRWLAAPSTGTPLGALIVNPTRPSSGRAARQEAAAQAVPLDVQAPARTASPVTTARIARLT